MSDSWDDCLNSKIAEWRESGLAREVHTAAGTGVRFEFRGRRILSFASNDYLGLAAHPAVVAAAKQALDEHGAGCSASPLICGHKPVHAALERELAAFKRSESALVFPSGYQAAVGTLAALATSANSVILDRLAHASLIDGAHLSKARVCTFKHNNVNDLKRLLQREHPRRCVVALESLYSMDGDIAPIDEIAGVCRQAGALLLVDEAHATGVLGETGRGALEALTTRLGGLPNEIVALGTLSKALGSQGGFICASKAVVENIIHTGRAYLFSTALSPACAGAAQAALKLVDLEPQRRTNLTTMANQIRAALAASKCPALDSTGPIIPIPAGEEQTAIRWKESLFEQRLYVPAIRYPTVKKGQARLRISVSAGHTDSDCDTLIAALKQLQK